MKTIFKATLFLLLICCATNSFAQDSTKANKKTREIILSIAGVSPLNISIGYKKQIKGGTFFKAEVIRLSGNNMEYKPTQTTEYGSNNRNISAGLQFGLEFRKNITSDFTFYHGPNIASTYLRSDITSKNPTLPVPDQRNIAQNYSVGVLYTVGVLCHLKNHFFLSAQINPGVFTNWDVYKAPQSGEITQKRISTSFGLGNTYGSLSIVYRL